MAEDGNRFAWFANAGEDEAEWLEAAEIEDWKEAGAPPVAEWEKQRTGWGWARRDAVTILPAAESLPDAPKPPELPALMLACTRDDAAALLRMSVDSLDRHVIPRLRTIQAGSMVRIPLAELQRWVDEQAARALSG